MRYASIVNSGDISLWPVYGGPGTKSDDFGRVVVGIIVGLAIFGIVAWISSDKDSE